MSNGDKCARSDAADSASTGDAASGTTAETSSADRPSSTTEERHHERHRSRDRDDQLTAEQEVALVSKEAESLPPRSWGLPRFLLIILGVVGVAFALNFAKDVQNIIAPIFLGVNLMITAYPVFTRLVAIRCPRWLAATLSGLVVFLVLIAFVAGLSWAISEMVTKLLDYGPQLNRLYTDGLHWLGSLGVDQQMIMERLKGIDPQSVLNVALTALSSAQGVASLLVVVITALIFMVMDTPSVRQRMEVARAAHPSFVGALESFATGIRKYWVVTTVFGLIVAVLDGLVLWWLDVPLFIVWALFSFLTNYIPNIGFVIGLIPPALLGLLEGGPKTAIIVIVAYSVLNFGIQSIIQPRFAGNAVGLSPTWSFLSLLLWTWVLGPLGALLALPASLFCKALFVDADPRARWINALISSDVEDAVSPRDRRAAAKAQAADAGSETASG